MVIFAITQPVSTLFPRIPNRIMAPTLDPAIIAALSLDPKVTNIRLYGGSAFSTTAKITTRIDGEEKRYFIKIGTGNDAKAMFRGQLASILRI
jgi:protein-ribulosamine 3-kinase